MNITINYEVSECRECPMCDVAVSKKRRFTYNICRKEERLLPGLKLIEEGEGWGVHSFVVVIPDWCPYKEEEKEAN